MTTKLVGEKVQRVEDDRLLRGHGRYVDDVLPGALESAVLRSPHAHARIVDIDVDAVLDLEGVLAVWTYDDLDGPMAEPLPLLIPHPDLTHGRTQHALAKDEVNHVGEAIAFVVATDRYVAEDALDLIRVTYDFLPPVVGVEAARAAELLVHEDVPGNVAAHSEQSNGDAEAAIASAPHTLSLDLAVERSASTPLEGRGVAARWDLDSGRLQVWSSTQTSTGVRAAIAAKLGLDLVQVDVVTPDVGGGFGVKIVHPWPEELLVPMAARALGRPVRFTEDRREHFISAAHERGQLQHVDVGFDDDGRLLGLSVQIWHDNGAYTPYGIIVPIITSTQLLGPYKPGAYKVVFDSLYTNTVLVTPYRGAGQAAGLLRHGAHDGRDRGLPRQGPHRGPRGQLHPARRVPLRPRPGLPGRAPAGVRLRRLPGRARQARRPWSGGTTSSRSDKKWRRKGGRVGIGIACYVEGTGVGPYEGAHVHVETSGKVKVALGLTSQGQGHRTVFAQIVADELGVPFEDVEVTTGDTRRMPYAVGTFASRAAVMSGSAVALAARQVRAKAMRIAADALEVSEADLEVVDGHVQVKGAPASRIALGTVAVLSNPLRYAFDEASKKATQFSVGDPDKPPVAEDDEPGLEGRDFYSPERSTFASGMHAVVVETDPDTAEVRDPQVRRRPRLRDARQPDDRRGADPRRRRAGRRRRALRADGLRRGRAAAQRVVHGLPDALRHRGPGRHRHRPHRDAVAAQPARDQGCRGGRRHPVRGGLRGRDRGRGGHHRCGACRCPRRTSSRCGRSPLVEPVETRRPPNGGVMKISGESTVQAPPAQVWAALLDPAVLVRTIPGCERLETTGEHAYAMTVTAGVAAIRGTYSGTCSLSDLKPHESLVLSAQGAGAPGTIGADVDVRFTDNGDGTTRISYDAEAIVGGTIGGVGQRMLGSVSRRMANEFFGNVDRALTGDWPPRRCPSSGLRHGGRGTPRSARCSPLRRARRDRSRGTSSPVSPSVRAWSLSGWRSGASPDAVDDGRCGSARRGSSRRRSRTVTCRHARCSRRTWSGSRRSTHASTRSCPSTPERARAAAHAADEAVAHGEPTGLLHGLPFAFKDTHEVAGWRTTSGSPLFRDHVPDPGRAARGADPCRRRGRGRAHQRAGVRRRLAHVQHALRHHPQPLRPEPLGRWLVGRCRGGPRHRHGAARRRLGHGRVAAQPGIVLQRRRAAPLPRPGAAVADQQRLGDHVGRRGRWRATSPTSRCCCP